MTDSFDIRQSPFGLPEVRHSNFVIRHCPAPHDATGRFDFVLANPPFNVNAVDDANCEVRSPRCEIRPVRHSKFGTRHSHRLWIPLVARRARVVMVAVGTNLSRGHDIEIASTWGPLNKINIVTQTDW
jgi:hypothetical protein